MLNFEAFSRYLDEVPNLRDIEVSGIGQQGKYIRQWSASIGMETENVQYQKIERLLAELNVASMEDSLRLNTLYKIRPTIEQVVGRLHQHYQHMPSILSAQQYQQADQVTSLYYLLLLVYKGAMDRVLNSFNSGQKNPLKRFIRPNNSPEKLLTRIIYEQMGLYLSLLAEAAILYKKPPELYWQQLNTLYALALRYECATTALTKEESNKASTIQDYYCQACLLSLLRPATYRRQDILSMLKILNSWSKQIVITNNLDISPKVFVDLDSNQGPQYLTAATKTNPYSTDRRCVFIDLSPLLNHIAEHEQLSVANSHLSQESGQVNDRRLAQLAATSLQPPKNTITNICYDCAQLISGFSLIHYYIAGRSSLFNIISYAQIPPTQRPIANTKPKDANVVHPLTVDITEIGKTFCRLFWSIEDSEEDSATSINFNLQVQSLIAIKRIDSEQARIKSKQKPRPPAYTNSLNTEILTRDIWELGIIRSMYLHENSADIEVQIIGTSATACGIRLDNKDGRRQNFVPALLLAGNEKLGSKTSLIVPKYHLRSKDRIVLRVANKQRLLVLDELLLKTDNIEQYTIMRA